VDAISVQEAKKAKKAVGDLTKLQTDAKDNTVEAINEIKNGMVTGSAPEVIETTILNVDTDEVRAFWLPFTGSCFIRGIKCTGNQFTGEFNLKIYTKYPENGGYYVYYSGKVVNVLWDIMDIPFTDESGERQVYVTIENKGAASSFLLQLYITKG
jgi:hypothetical protein